MLCTDMYLHICIYKKSNVNNVTCTFLGEGGTEWDGGTAWNTFFLVNGYNIIKNIYT